MRAWFMVGAMILGLIGIWGEQGRVGRGGRAGAPEGASPVKAMDGGSTIPTPKAP